MYEIRIHGRGGQGSKTAARILGRACFLEGRHVQDFSVYGAERRGAPVSSFVRADTRPILERGQLASPDGIIVMDETLLNTMDVTEGPRKGGIVFLNTASGASPIPGAHILDVSGIALRYTGRNIISAIVTGGFAKLSGICSQESLKKAIQVELGPKLSPETLSKNINGMTECWEAAK